MPVLKNVLGLDLGAHSLKAVELRQTFRGLEAIQLRTLPRSGADVSTPELVRQFADLHRFARDHVVTALPADKLSTRRLEFPFREKRRLLQAVPFTVEGDLPFDIDDVVLDWTVIGGDRNRAEVLVAIAPRSEVSELLDQLGEAGCAPRTLEAEGLVLSNLAAIFDLPGRRLLVDLGHTKTTLCVTVDGKPVAARTVPIGGRDLTEALASDRGISFDEAERVKCEEGVFAPDGSTPPQTGKVLDRLVREILRTLGAVEQIVGGVLDGITLFGGGALLGRIDAYLAEQTGIPTERLGLPREGTDEGLVAGGPPILFAPAIALALRGTAQARTEMNFRQDEFALRMDVGQVLRNLRVTGVLAAAAILLALVGFVARVGIEASQARSLERQATRLYTEAFPGQPVPDDPMVAMRQQVTEARERADFLGIYGNLSALDLLTEISRLVPPDLDIALEEISIDGQTVRMRVNAENFRAADRLRTELVKYPAFANARNGPIETDPKTGSKRFNVTISLQDEDRS